MGPLPPLSRDKPPLPNILLSNVQSLDKKPDKWQNRLNTKKKTSGTALFWYSQRSGWSPACPTAQSRRMGSLFIGQNEGLRQVEVRGCMLYGYLFENHESLCISNALLSDSQDVDYQNQNLLPPEGV